MTTAANPVSIAVRDAIPDDAASIHEIAVAAWRATYAGLIDPGAIERFLAQAYTRERIGLRMERHDLLVAGTDAIESFAESVIEDGHVQLVAIYTHPESRGHGLGSALLAVVRERNPGLDIAADVLVGNALGEPFYVARGFEPGELLTEELGGEPIRERRWWLRTGSARNRA